MIETVYQLKEYTERTIKKHVMKNNGQYTQITLPKGTGLPIHLSNAELFMTVLKGNLSIGLDKKPVQNYPSRTMLNIPYQTLMNVRNEDEEILELLLVKIIPDGKDKI